MTDHAEEQEMEAEAMAAIFDTFFEVLEPARWSATIYPESGDPSELEALNHVGCKLLISLPDTYPEDGPDLDIEIVKGLAEEQRILLKQLADEEALANRGVPCMYAVAERLREWLVENNVKGLDDVSMHAQMMRKKLQLEKAQQSAQSVFESQKQREDMTEAEREELEVTKRRAEGTPCTKENFEAWQNRFVQEMAEARALGDETDEKKKKDKSKEVDKSGRMTGFDLFSNKLVNLEALEAAAEQVEQEFDGDEELFQDDVDLDDLDFDEDDEESDEDNEEDEELDI